MYDFFRGSVASLDTSGHLSLAVQGVGYLLRISEQTRASLPLDGSEVTVYARLIVREDDLQLFGFADPAERAAFDLLTSVQGVGPVVALGVLSGYGVAELRQILIRKDVAALKKIKGVGAKSAERIGLELNDKVDRIPAPFVDNSDGTSPIDSAHDEARQALVALGFGNKDAVDAIAKVADQAQDAESLLRLALGALR
ncbi:MAG: Holliday junction branch migration protein RuvA [Planctomycetota bacterium]|jgi:Holliday junction DNA helicase RuvA|nr:Holliday junction branch migration protein RuvA [Planctomycetota bacterium]